MKLFKGIDEDFFVDDDDNENILANILEQNNEDTESENFLLEEAMLYNPHSKSKNNKNVFKTTQKPTINGKNNMTYFLIRILQIKIIK